MLEGADECQNLPMRLFNMRQFHAELDEQRRRRGLSWTELAAEINRTFETPDGPKVRSIGKKLAAVRLFDARRMPQAENHGRRAAAACLPGPGLYVMSSVS